MKHACHIANEYITYIFTRDRVLLEGYYNLREKIYVNDFNLKDFKDHEDDYDEKAYSHMLIVRDGSSVIGGARIIFHHKCSDVLLPFENDNFYLKNILPELQLDNKSYCEVDRTVLSPQYRHGFIGEEIVKLVAMQSKILGSEYLFTIGPAIQVRNNRRHCAKLGINFTIVDGVEIPDHPSFEGKKMYLTVTDLCEV